MKRWMGFGLGICVAVTGVAMVIQEPKVDPIAKAAASTFAVVSPRFQDNSDPSKFGMSRMASPAVHNLTVHAVKSRAPGSPGKNAAYLVFDPNSETDRALVANLKKAGRDVSFYTVGIGISDRMRGPAVVDRGMELGPEISSIITELKSVRKKPASFGEAFRKGKWRFYAASVAATNAKCLRCHGSAERSGNGIYRNSLKTGDAVGIMVIAVKDDLK